MSCTIEVKRRRVFIVGGRTFENRKDAQQYLDAYPYEYNGKRYSTKYEVRSKINDQKEEEIKDAFHETAKFSIWSYDARYVNAGGGWRLIKAMGNVKFLKKALQIAEKYDRLMEPFKEDEE